MKKFIAGAVLLGASSMAFANPGCGVGSMIWDGQDGAPAHILAATTNGISGNQTFGMTTGTLGCDTSDTVQNMAMYMDSNMDKVARDMSRGDGENLDTLAGLLGIQGEDREAFKAQLQQNFNAVFPDANTTSDQATDSIVEIMEADENLSRYLG